MTSFAQFSLYALIFTTWWFLLVLVYTSLFLKHSRLIGQRQSYYDITYTFETKND